MKEYNKGCDTVACVVDTVDSCLPHTQFILKNINDQTVFKLSEKYSVLVGKDLNELLQYAKKNYKFIIIVPTGIDFLDVNVIKITGPITDLSNQISKNYSLYSLDKLDLANMIFYLNGLDEIEFSKGMEWQLKKYNINNTLFYPINNEPIYNLNLSTIEQLVTPCAGTNWIKYLNTYGFNDNTVVRFYDNNYLALDCMRNLLQWDGKNFDSFIKELGSQKFSFVNKPWDYGFASLYDEPALDNWNTIKNTVKFEFRLINVLEEFDINELIDAKKNTFINFSNIFTYYLTSGFYSLKYKVDKEISLLQKLKNYDCHIGFITRAYHVYGDGLLYGHISDFTDYKNISLPSWYD